MLARVAHPARGQDRGSALAGGRSEALVVRRRARLETANRPLSRATDRSSPRGTGRSPRQAMASSGALHQRASLRASPVRPAGHSRPWLITSPASSLAGRRGGARPRVGRAQAGTGAGSAEGGLHRRASAVRRPDAGSSRRDVDEVRRLKQDAASGLRRERIPPRDADPSCSRRRTISRCPDGVDRRSATTAAESSGGAVSTTSPSPGARRGSTQAQGVAAVVGDDHGVDHGGGRWRPAPERGAVLTAGVTRAFTQRHQQGGNAVFADSAAIGAAREPAEKPSRGDDFADRPEDPRDSFIGRGRTNELRPSGSAGSVVIPAPKGPRHPAPLDTLFRVRAG